MEPVQTNTLYFYGNLAGKINNLYRVRMALGHEQYCSLCSIYDYVMINAVSDPGIVCSYKYVYNINIAQLGHPFVNHQNY